MSEQNKAVSTPAATWCVNGEDDPHGDYYDRERAALTLGNLTDDELANGAFMNYDHRPSLEDLLAGKAFMPIVWMTGVKDRIRWLSRALVKAQANAAPPKAEPMAQWEPMTDEQRARWKETGLFPVERWDKGAGGTPLVCPMPTNEELRVLASAVPEHIQLSGWYIGKPAFGHRYLYADNFRGMGRQWVCDFPSDKGYFDGLADYVAAVHPRTVIRLLDRIEELEAQPQAAPVVQGLDNAAMLAAFDSADSVIDGLHEVLRLAQAAPRASMQQAHVDLTGLAERLLAPREIVRDEYGHLYNPAFPILDEGDDVRMFLGAFGIELCQVSMESDCDDEALCEAVWAGEKGCGEWVPTPPEGEGWLLSDIFDTEDGPYALFIRRKPKELKKSRRERYAAAAPAEAFQARVHPWMMKCFGAEIAADQHERNHRFLEEALELVQACGATASEAHQLVDYVYGRPVGEKHQEAGGVMVTLAALCLAQGLDMHAAGETELARIWTKVEQIRAKQAAKPKHSPLPEHVPPATGADDARDALVLDALKGAKSLLEELPAHEIAGTRTSAAYIAVCAALRAGKDGETR